MSKLIAAAVASMFALGAASGYAQTGYKKEQLTTEQKTEIRDRAERLKAERTKMETTKPAAAPQKAAKPKHTSNADKPGKHVAKAVAPKPAVMKTPPKA